MNFPQCPAIREGQIADGINPPDIQTREIAATGERMFSNGFHIRNGDAPQAVTIGKRIVAEPLYPLGDHQIPDFLTVQVEVPGIV